eukprot:CAMPEP_0170497348 /NCGR_PEP_ID=MMETSP0208-20121228/24544_1 /TAXON_ID=197538 /ORGANISM="Strombidium inclinatum, Strain S3" /LENGTH=69 /DNA_ID=CAMNT_0010774143 /DNA_START=873 /DNA_END=1082 /DNA_ORIENTATION=-
MQKCYQQYLMQKVRTIDNKKKIAKTLQQISKKKQTSFAPSTGQTGPTNQEDSSSDEDSSSEDSDSSEYS